MCFGIWIDDVLKQDTFELHVWIVYREYADELYVITLESYKTNATGQRDKDYSLTTS